MSNLLSKPYMPTLLAPPSAPSSAAQELPLPTTPELARLREAILRRLGRAIAQTDGVPWHRASVLLIDRYGVVECGDGVGRLAYLLKPGDAPTDVISSVIRVAALDRSVFDAVRALAHS